MSVRAAPQGVRGCPGRELFVLVGVIVAGFITLAILLLAKLTQCRVTMSDGSSTKIGTRSKAT